LDSRTSRDAREYKRLRAANPSSARRASHECGRRQIGTPLVEYSTVNIRSNPRRWSLSEDGISRSVSRAEMRWRRVRRVEPQGSQNIAGSKAEDIHVTREEKKAISQAGPAGGK